MKPKFEVNNFYMHDLYKDICIQVAEILPTLEKDTISFYAYIWNLGYSGRPWLVDSQRYLYLIQDSTNWVELDPEDMTTTRTRPGLPRRSNA